MLSWGKVPTTVRWAVFVGVLIHIFGFFYVYGGSGLPAFIHGDGIGYTQLAQNLADGRGFVIRTAEGTFEPETFRLPGLPLVMAVFLKLGLGFTGFLIALTLLSAIVIPLCGWYLGRMLFSESVGKGVAWLLTLEPFIWIYSWYTLTEIPFVMLSLLSFALYARALSRPAWTYAAGAGVLAAAAVYVRPAGLALFAVVFLSVTAYYLVRRAWPLFRLSFLAGFLTVLLLVPWLMWMHAHTGVYALSGTGWRNVYTDYLASVRALKNETGFYVEKEALKEYAGEAWGLSRYEINRPDNAHILRDYALRELAKEPATVMKLETLLLFTYFTNTDYYARFYRLGVVPVNKASISVSQVFLREGLGGIPIILQDMQKRYFIPIVERLWAFLLLGLAVVGVYAGRRRPIVWLLVAVLGVTALTATAIGLGVEARLRIPILPYYYMLVVSGAAVIWGCVRTRLPYEKH